MLGNIGPLEIIVVLIIALIVFGPKRLPELGNSLGKGIREFKDSVTGDDARTTKPQEDAAKSIGTPKAVDHTIEPPTTHRIEADKAEAVPDKTA